MVGVDPVGMDPLLLYQVRITPTSGARILYKICGSIAFTYLTITSSAVNVSSDVPRYVLRVLLPRQEGRPATPKNEVAGRVARVRLHLWRAHATAMRST